MLSCKSVTVSLYSMSAILITSFKKVTNANRALGCLQKCLPLVNSIGEYWYHCRTNGKKFCHYDECRVGVFLKADIKPTELCRLMSINVNIGTLFVWFNSSHIFKLTLSKFCTVLMDALKTCMWIVGSAWTFSKNLDIHLYSGALLIRTPLLQMPYHPDNCYGEQNISRPSCFNYPDTSFIWTISLETKVSGLTHLR
jgi:hypothetical protein